MFNLYPIKQDFLLKNILFKKLTGVSRCESRTDSVKSETLEDISRVSTMKFYHMLCKKTQYLN